MIRTTLADKPEQFVTGNDEKHVGRRVLLNGYPVSRKCDDISAYSDAQRVILFRLDCDAGLVFVDPSILRPYPSEPIEEPKT